MAREERLRSLCVHMWSMYYIVHGLESLDSVLVRACEEVIEADNSEVRPPTLSGLTRTCDSIQASSTVSATH